jgi:YHS domain-containing protein
MLKRVSALVALSLFAFAAMAVEPVNKTLISKLAIDGYDPVAYFTDGKPVEGKKQFEYRWMNANWRFASAEHRDLFAKNPDKYSPQFGGYCAYGISQGHAVSIDPEAWRIVDGKLYLNYSKDVQKKWLVDIPGFIKKAEQNWPKILAE